ncbi:CdaR family protein [Robertmurraya massiliosenegalensis]|uniref:CdaR family protein n=1 Tax=Robertmurraya massiliosenegalensis TaxID=1287657 RepID=UPI00031442D3|nr:CdaR family protein [Robertmurraya massiliosenegalensis]
MDKYINKLIENKWFIRVIALALAVLLFENVVEENNSVVNVPQDQESEVIEAVPVTSIYDADNLVVTGVPETVKLTLSGPRANLQQALTQRGFEVYVDLTDAEIGTQEVEIQIRDISERLKVSIDPATITVSVQEKVTKEFNVEAEFDSNILAEGYISDIAIVEPNKVTITGAKDVIEKITYVKAPLDVTGPINETIKRDAEILVLDQALNKLDVLVEPSNVEVTIPVKASTKTVPINVVQSGTLPAGVTIESIRLETEEAKIIASEEVLNRTDSVRVELDVSEIEKDTEVTLPVIISEGIIAVDPQVIKVSIRANKTEDRTFSNVPIQIEGLPEQYEAVFQEPSNGSTSITLSGNSGDITSLTASNFRLYIDASDRDAGEHEIEIQVDGPENVEWKLARETVKVLITQEDEQ